MGLHWWFNSTFHIHWKHSCCIIVICLNWQKQQTLLAFVSVKDHLQTRARSWIHNRAVSFRAAFVRGFVVSCEHFSGRLDWAAFTMLMFFSFSWERFEGDVEEFKDSLYTALTNVCIIWHFFTFYKCIVLHLLYMTFNFDYCFNMSGNFSQVCKLQSVHIKCIRQISVKWRLYINSHTKCWRYD